MNASRFKIILLALACAVLAACHWPNLSDDDDPPDDFGQKTLKKHYEDGDINDYQYQQSLKQFTPPDPNAQKPAASSGTSTPAATAPAQP